MSYRRNPTEVSLRGSLCRDLLEMVASGMSANEAAKLLIAELLKAPNSHYSIRQLGNVFVFERRKDASAGDSSRSLFQ